MTIQVIVALFGIVAIWMGIKLATLSLWLELALLVATFVLIEVIILKFVPFKSKRREPPRR